MICVNELSELKCNNYQVLKELVIILSPYAPHIAEELWQILGEKDSITKANYPVFNPDYLIESSFSYPISINGKHRTNIEFALDAPQAEIEAAVLADEIILKWLAGNSPKKIILVKGKIINLVL
jgi:leucyl-tRNA synthetase